MSSARLYSETQGSRFFTSEGHQRSGRRQRFPRELYQAPRSWAERAYPNLIHYNRLAKGGHFAAWEQPSSSPKNCAPVFRSLREKPVLECRRALWARAGSLSYCDGGP